MPATAPLLERARAENDRVVLSVFVNPAQFDDPDDLARYPRTLEADLALAGGLADLVLAPEPREMYPDDYRYRVTESALSARLEGAHRPGHFDGVLTVVLKLLNLVRPHRAYFGEKDWQQLQLVRGMAGRALPSRGDRPLPHRARRRRPRAQLAQPPAVAGRAGAGRLVSEDPARLARLPAAAARALGGAGFGVDYVEDHDGVRLGAVRLEDVRLIDNVRL